MVKYFNELDDIDNFQIYTMHNNRFNCDNKDISLEFYKKYYEIFDYINNINRINELKLLKNTCNITDLKERCLKQLEIINLISQKYQADSNMLYRLLMNGNYDDTMHLLSKIDKLGSLDLNKILVLYYYLIDIINPFNDKGILSTIKSALYDLNETNKQTIYGREINIINLPKYWYILPNFHELDERLYNTVGINSHKEANLIYPYCLALSGILLNPRDFIDKIKDIEENGVSLNDYMYYVGYGMDKLPNPIDNNSIKSYMQNNILVTSGSVMANGLLWEYFTNLKNKTNDYSAALNMHRSVILDDFLVRFVGFSKVVLRADKKIISTSNLAYQDEFREYIERGWNIDFTTPLAFNYSKNQIEEMDDSFVKLKQFHID